MAEHNLAVVEGGRKHEQDLAYDTWIEVHALLNLLDAIGHADIDAADVAALLRPIEDKMHEVGTGHKRT